MEVPKQKMDAVATEETLSELAMDAESVSDIESVDLEGTPSELALDALSIFSIRLLSADMVERANSGHLGTAWGCAPLANALWGKIMNFSPQQRWINRDRFVLSGGHASALLYSMLHITGYGMGGPHEVSMESLKQFRKAGSSLPGHPEVGITSGVEVTTGPLGQGFANGVGMAISEAHLAARFNREGYPIFDNYTYVVAGDGCLMEGISSEAASLAGHLQLHKLIVFYDDNEVTIDGKTDLAFSEDVGGRFAAMGWNVLRISNGDLYNTDIYEEAVREAKSQTEKPSVIIMKTTIGSGAGKGVEGTSKAHGGKFSKLDQIRRGWFSPEGLRSSGDVLATQVAQLVQEELNKCAGDVVPSTEVLPAFHVPSVVLKKFRDAGKRGDKLAVEWEAMVQRYCNELRASEPELVRDLEERLQGKYVSDSWKAKAEEYLSSQEELITAGLDDLKNSGAEDARSVASTEMLRRSSVESRALFEPLPVSKTTEPAKKYKYKAGRVYCSEMLQTFAKFNPALIGGSADVASSVGAHFPAIQGHFLPDAFAEKYEGASYQGRYIHFGVREHATLAVLNGIASYGLLIPYSVLFTIFYQYGLPAVRMASISKFPVLYVGTHDSIDLGEDGPTHQPVEVLPQLRATPNLLVIRPADVSEMAGAFEIYADHFTAPRCITQHVPDPMTSRPVFIMTSRSELGLPFRRNSIVDGKEGVKRGAYVVHECFDGEVQSKPDIVLIGSGQDVAQCMQVKQLLLKWSQERERKPKTSVACFPASAFSKKSTPVKVRVVSMPCWELFDEQEQEYQDSVLLTNHSDVLRVYVEKASSKNTGHEKYADFAVVMSSYGLSGKGAEVERQLDFTPEYVAAKVWSSWVHRSREPQGKSESGIRHETWVSRFSRRVGTQLRSACACFPSYR